MIVDINLKQELDSSYKIFIEPLKKISLDKRVAIVTNPTVSKFHLKKVTEQIDAKELHIIEIPDGEQYKTMITIEEILSELFESRFNRKSLIIALGGGVIGDMTGFAASIFQRGIEFIQIPTTLLSMVDASVGGKTGVNNSFGKNLVGAFHQPKAVHIDVSFLDTLPKREFGAGVAEIVKMAVMFDRDFFAFLESANLEDRDTLKKAVKRSVELKAEVVSQDEKEKGIRAVLNYGHTFGHVMEMETKYSKYLHGECVSMGMVMANKLALAIGDFSSDDETRVLKLLQSYNIPTDYSIEDCDRFYEAFFLDKKSSDDEITFILPKKLGEYQMRKDLTKETVLKVLKNFSK